MNVIISPVSDGEFEFVGNDAKECYKYIDIVIFDGELHIVSCDDGKEGELFRCKIDSRSEGNISVKKTTNHIHISLE